MLELTASIGAATWLALWIPVLLWTVVAGGCWYMLSRTDRLHPQTHYSARLALLASLPVGLGLTWLLPPLLPAAWLPTAWWSTPSAAAPIEPLLLPPSTALVPLPVAEVAAPLSLPFLLLGGLTLLAAVATLVWFARLLYDVAAVQQLRRRLLAQPVPTVQEEAHALARSLGIRRSVQVRTTAHVPVPLTCGTRRPLIVVPRKLSRDDRRLALMHELLHVRRFDYLLNLVGRALTALCAWHPLMHRLYAEACTYREITNDAAVLQQPGVARQPYASLLLRFADAPASRYLTALSFAQPRSSLKNRIYAMSQPSSTNRPQPIFTLLLAMLLMGSIGTFMACSDVAVDTPSDDTASLPSLSDATIFEVVETMPEPVGGMEAIMNEIAYTEEAKEAGVEGRVIVQFVVDAEGNVRQPEVVRGLGSGLDEAAVDALEAVEWRAGEQNNEPVHVQMAFPVTFRLSDAETRSSETETSDVLIEVLHDSHIRVNGDYIDEDYLHIRIQQLTEDMSTPSATISVREDAPMGTVHAVQDAVRESGIERIRMGTPESIADRSHVPMKRSPAGESSTQNGQQVFEVVEQMPEPVNGAASVQQRITYPETAKRAGIEGRVLVRFIVDEQGQVQQPVVVRGIGGGADEEALRVIQETTFTPGMQRGHAVPVRMSWPITFRLPGNEGTTSSQTSVNSLRIERMNERMANLPPEAIASIDVKRDEGPNGTVTITLKEGMALEFTDGQRLQASSTDNDQPTFIIRRS